MSNLGLPKSPNLPIAPVSYARQHFDLLNNVFRLYFNRIDGLFQSLLGASGGAFLEFPHIGASHNAIQYATANNIPTIVNWDTLDSGSGFTLNVDNTATADLNGIYKITYSIQFANNANAVHDAHVWLRINGATSAADVAKSTTLFTIPARKSAGVPSYVCAYSEVVFELNAGDKVGLWWGTDQAATSGGTLGVYMFYQGAQTTPMAYPAVPSVIGSIVFVSHTAT